MSTPYTWLDGITDSLPRTRSDPAAGTPHPALAPTFPAVAPPPSSLPNSLPHLSNSGAPPTLHQAPPSLTLTCGTAGSSCRCTRGGDEGSMGGGEEAPRGSPLTGVRRFQWHSFNGGEGAPRGSPLAGVRRFQWHSFNGTSTRLQSMAHYRVHGVIRAEGWPKALICCHFENYLWSPIHVKNT